MFPIHAGSRASLVLPMLAALAALVLPAAAVAHERSAEAAAALEGTTHLDPIKPFTDGAQGETAVSSRASGPGPTARSLAQTCTPQSTATDNTAKAYHPANSRVLKVIYAYPTDVGNRIGTYAPVIQSGMRLASEVIAGESGNRKSLRFDLGTAAGPDCVDIQVVPLLLPASAYTAAPSTTFSLIRTELLARTTLQGGSRNFIVYADGVKVPGVGGEAQVRSDDSPAGSLHGLGGLWGILYGRGGTDFFGSGNAYPAGSTSRSHVDLALHEIGHTLGAVQRSAPHATSSFHCLDEWDALCYDDDGAGGRSTYVACNTPTSQSWDCNKDDYFNPAPPPGSYLATHWNLYNSVFMCPVAGCAPGGVYGPPVFQSASAADTVPPETRINQGPRKQTRDRTPTFGFSSSERGSSFECSYRGRGFGPCISPFTLPKQKLKPQVFRVRAIDAAGNRDDSPASRKFRISGRRR
jgi:hypothetical protein